MYATEAMNAGPRKGHSARTPRRWPCRLWRAASATRASPGRASSMRSRSEPVPGRHDMSDALADEQAGGIHDGDAGEEPAHHVTRRQSARRPAGDVPADLDHDFEGRAGGRGEE